MEDLITNITSNPVYLLIAVIIIIAVTISIVKKLLKAVVMAIAVLIIYLGYMSFTGEKVPTTKDEFFKHGTKQIEKIKKAGEKQFNGLIQKKVKDSAAVSGKE